MKVSEIITALAFVIAVAAAIKFFFFPNVVTKTETKLIERPDSTLYRQAAAEADSLRGRLEIIEIGRLQERQEKEGWRHRALAFKRMADSALYGARDSSEDIVGVLHETLAAPPDSAGRIYHDTLDVRHSFMQDLWAARIGYQPRRVFFTRTDTLRTESRVEIDWKATGGIGLAAGAVLYLLFSR